MGSSVSGSLDKFAKVSPAAAVGSGKVKLPGELGLAGMVQEDMIANAEAKQTPAVSAKLVANFLSFLNMLSPF